MIVRDKLSEKLSRRDVQYFDLYAHREPEDDYRRMTGEGFPYTKEHAQIKELYGDLAYPDFNQIFLNRGHIITKAYGKTIKTSLFVKKNPETGGISISR